MPIVFNNADGPRLTRTANLPAYNAITVTCWFNLIAVKSGEFGNLIIWADKDETAGWSEAVGFIQASDGTRAMQVVSLAGGPTTIFTPSALNVWCFGAISCAGIGATDVKGYGAEGTNTLSTASCDGGTSAFTLAWLNVGATNVTLVPGAYPAKARVAAIKVWDAVLTQAEIEAERWSYLPQRWANLNIFSPLIGESRDFGPNQRNWTEGGTITWAYDGPPIAWGAAQLIVGVPAVGVTAVSSTDSSRAGMSEIVWSTGSGLTADTAKQGRTEAIQSSATATTGEVFGLGTADPATLAVSGLTGDEIAALLSDGTLINASVQLADILGITATDAVALVTAILTGTDAPTVGLVESPLIAAVLNLADVLGAGYDETGAFLPSVATADLASLGLTDLADTLTVAAQAADTYGLTLADAIDLISVIVSAADDVGLVLDEAPLIAAVLEIADTLGLIAAETGAALDVTPSGVPTYRIGMADLTALLTIFVKSADEWAIGASDAVSLVNVILTLADEAGVGLTDVASLQAILSLADELGIHYAEAATAVEPGGTLLSADVLPLGLTEVTDLIAAVSSAAETLRLGLADTADTLTALLQNEEAISLSVGEPASIFAALDLADSLGLTLADLATLVELGNTIASSDSLRVGLTDLAALISAILDTADTLGVGTAEAANILATVMAAAETIGIHLDDAPLIAAVLSLADELGIHLTELATVIEPPTFISSDDVAAVGLTDLVAALSAAVQAADALTLGLTDAVSLITTLASTADTIGLSLDDTLGAFLTTATSLEDSGALGQADAAAIALGTLNEIGEALAVGADETVRGIFSILPHEDVPLGLVEAVSEMAGTLSAGDTITAALLEQPSILALLQLPADDLLRIGYAEVTVAGEVGVYRVGHVIIATVTCWLEDRTCEAVVAAHTVSSLMPDYTVEDLECAA